MQENESQSLNDFYAWRRDTTTRKFFRRVATLRKHYVDMLVHGSKGTEEIREVLGIIKGLQVVLDIDADDFKEDNLEQVKDEV